MESDPAGFVQKKKKNSQRNPQQQNVSTLIDIPFFGLAPDPPAAPGPSESTNRKLGTKKNLKSVAKAVGNTITNFVTPKSTKKNKPVQGDPNASVSSSSQRYAAAAQTVNPETFASTHSANVNAPSGLPPRSHSLSEKQRYTVGPATSNIHGSRLSLKRDRSGCSSTNDMTGNAPRSHADSTVSCRSYLLPLQPRSNTINARFPESVPAAKGEAPGESGPRKTSGGSNGSPPRKKTTDDGVPTTSREAALGQKQGHSGSLLSKSIAGLESTQPQSPQMARSSQIFKLGRLENGRPPKSPITIAYRACAHGHGAFWDHYTIQHLTDRRTIASHSREVNPEFNRISNHAPDPEHYVPGVLRYESIDTTSDSGEGLLIITGGSYGLDTEQHGTHRPSANALPRHLLRVEHERALLKEAQLQGRPVLGICGGSWRVLESYGGTTNALPANTHQTRRSMAFIRTRGFISDNLRQHPLTLKRDGLLRQNWKIVKNPLPPSSKQQGPKNPKRPVQRYKNFPPRRQSRPWTRLTDAELQAGAPLLVNSAHWAAAAEDVGPAGQRSFSAYEGRAAVLPDWSGVYRAKRELLEVVARTGVENPDNSYAEDPNGTIEAFGTTRGAPVMGIQWHPEAYILNLDGASAAELSKELVLRMVMAGDAFDARRNMTREFDKDVNERVKNNFASGSDLNIKISNIIARSKSTIIIDSLTNLKFVVGLWIENSHHPDASEIEFANRKNEPFSVEFIEFLNHILSDLTQTIQTSTDHTNYISALKNIEQYFRTKSALNEKNNKSREVSDSLKYKKTLRAFRRLIRREIKFIKAINKNLNQLENRLSTIISRAKPRAALFYEPAQQDIINAIDDECRNKGNSIDREGEHILRRGDRIHTSLDGLRSRLKEAMSRSTNEDKVDKAALDTVALFGLKARKNNVVKEPVLPDIQSPSAEELMEGWRFKWRDDIGADD